MTVEIRLYKRFDMDLVSLYDSGYSVSSMIKDAVIGYANSMPVHFYVDEQVAFDLNDKTSVHTRFSVPESDVKTCYMLRNIKHGYRNTFCKMILRNALVQQNLSGFFADPTLAQLQASNMTGRSLYSFQNVKPCSQMKMKNRQVEILGQAVDVEKIRTKRKPGRPKKEPAISQMPQYGNPFAGMNPYMQMPAAPYQNYPAPYAQPQQLQNGYAQNVSAPQAIPSPAPVVAPATAPVEPVSPAPQVVSAPFAPQQIQQESVPVPSPVPVAAPVAAAAVQEPDEMVDLSQDNVNVEVAEDKELLAMFDAL